MYVPILDSLVTLTALVTRVCFILNHHAELKEGSVTVFFRYPPRDLSVVKGLSKTGKINLEAKGRWIAFTYLLREDEQKIPLTLSAGFSMGFT